MKVPVLMYHEINSEEKLHELSKYINKKYIVIDNKFKEQLAYLSSRQYKPVNISELIKLKNNSALAITFDDGYKGNYLYAFPILKKFNFRATFFITSGWIGMPNMLSWKEIKEMSDYGMEIGSHTCSHALLETLSPEEIRRELEGSKKAIEQNIDREVKSISYPNGSFNRTVNKIARESGYASACVSEFQYWDTDKPSFNIPRIAPKSGLGSFTKVIERDKSFLFQERVKEGLKKTFRTIAGRKLYNTIYMKAFNLKDAGGNQ